MEPNPIALYMLIIIGAGFACGGLYLFVRKWPTAQPPKFRLNAFVVAALGIGMVGVGGWGPGFMTDYSKFLKDLVSIGVQYKESTVKSVMEDISQGKVPPEYQEVARAYMLQNPPKNMIEIIDQTLEHAKGEGKEFLEETRAEFERKEKVADLAVEGLKKREAAPDSDTGESVTNMGVLDNTTLQILGHRPQQDLKKLAIDPKKLESLLQNRHRVIRPGP